MESISTNIEQEKNADGVINVDDFIESALHYATDLGWRVFPVHSVRADGSCTCSKGSDCESPGKHPRITGWPEKATTDSDVIRRWWEKWPNSNVGIACGEESGLAVLDEDPRNGGNESLRLLEGEHGALPHTLEVASGGGGRHYYFDYPERGVPSCKLADGLDLQSDRRYVVAPPSLHPSGGTYEWKASIGDADRPELQPLPNWIRAEALGSGSSASSKRLPPPEPGEMIHEGERNERLTSFAGHLFKDGFDEATVEAKLLDFNEKQCIPSLPEKEVRKLVRSIAKRDAKSRDRGEPEGPDPFGFTLASEIEPEVVEWFWPDRIPLRKITLLVGDGGLGKSTVSLDLAARLTRGKAMPGTSHQPEAGRVLILSTEDSPRDTIRPRLGVAGAELRRVKIQTKGGVSFPGHLGELESEIERFGADLVILDPLAGFLGSEVSMNDPQGVRSVLSPLKEIAEKTDCTFVAVVHLNKKEGAEPRHRILGSGDLVNAARSVMLVGEDPENRDRRVIAQTKGNLGTSAKALAFSVVSSEENPDVAAISWEGESPFDSHDLLNPRLSSAPSKKKRAKVFIKNTLQDGPVRSTEVLRLADRKGFSETTLKRAKRELSNVTSKRLPSSFDDREWYWLLSEHVEDFESGEWSEGGPRESVISLEPTNGGKPSNGRPATKERMDDSLGLETQIPERATESANGDTLGGSDYETKDYNPSLPPRGSGFQSLRDGVSPHSGPNRLDASPEDAFPNETGDRFGTGDRR